MSGVGFARRDWLIAAFLCLLTTLTLQLASRRQGFTRDEGTYFTAAELQVGYLEESLRGLTHGHPTALFDRQVIDRYFQQNREHPPLMKTLFGLSWRLLHRCDCPNEPGLHPLPYRQRHATLGLLRQGDAMRLPAHLLAGALVAGVYLLGALSFSPGVGLLGALLTLLEPRLFFHAQLACFDAPVAAMILLTCVAYLRMQLGPSRRQGVIFGLLLGLGLLTKHNTFFLPIVLLGHSLWLRRAMLRGLGGLPAAGKLRRLFAWVVAPWTLYAGLLSPLVFFVGWPHLWPAPLGRFAEYVAFHVHHVHYNFEYLGVNYNRPPYPWHYVPLMTLLTAPVTTLLLALIGLFGLRRQAGAPALLVLLGIAWPMLVIMRPGTPIFGAEKHWLPSMPFVALLAAVGLSALLGRLALLRPGRWAQPAVGGLAGLLVCLPALVEVKNSHPYGLSHYNQLAGGPAGAADLGMNRQFWGYSLRGLMPELNRLAPPAAAVYFHDANLTVAMSVKDGLLRRDLRDSGMEEPGVRAADLGVVILEKHFAKYDYWFWDAFGTTRPTAVLTHEGVPIVTMYARPQRN